MAYNIDLQIEVSSGKIWNGDNWVTMSDDYGIKILDKEPTITFTIDYPVTNPMVVTLTHEDKSPWTRRQFIEAVIAAYKDIYAAEVDPGHIPGMLNRKTSTGPFGIWGHDIGDLVLEGAYKNNDGTWGLTVGS
jgi:hypothetical protein